MTLTEPANPSPRRALRYAQVAMAVALAALAGAVMAHATLVIGDLELVPDPPIAGEAVQVSISLVDPLLVAVEKALVRVEFREIDPEDPSVPASITGTEATEFLALPFVLGTDYLPETEAGVYSGTLVAPAEGRYTVSVRDTTFRNEEAIANVGVNVGADAGVDAAVSANGVIAFVLPPTPLAPSSWVTWLLWIVGIPLAAGLVVTFFALRRPAEPEPEEKGGQGDGGVRQAAG